MHNWLDAISLPLYHSLDDLIPISWLTLPDHNDPLKNTTKFSSGDTYELFQENLKTQPKNWHYRTKEVEYIVNSKGYRTQEFSNIDWKNSIVVLGCSMTAGIGVHEDETISYFLEQKTGRPVINLGVPAAGLDFNLYNNFLLRKNYPTPWAVVNLFTNVNRLIQFKNLAPEFLGLWSTEDEYWRGYMREEHNSIIKSIYNIEQVKFMWKDTNTFYASWFDDTAHYGKMQRLQFDNEARDLVHCGPVSNKRNATLIWSYLRNN